VAARLSIGFALDVVKLGGFGRDVIDGLLLAAITQANTAQIGRSPELQRRYALLEAPPPDELRRPVSINAVAASLHIPFETARRRIAKLRDIGVVQVSAAGVIVPQAPLETAVYRIAVEANYNLVRQLYRRLSGAGLLDDLVKAPPEYGPDKRPVRLVIRLSGDYVLRLAEPITLSLGDVVTGLVLMDIIHANTEHLPDSEGGDETEAGFVSDEMRRPVRVSTLSTRLGIPAETVRRHVARLQEPEICLRTKAGYVVPAAAAAHRPFIEFMATNHMNLHRLFQSLADYGVVAAWDAEDAALRGAA
jgi:DNA-binding Lrp family transcriptional regulator